MEFRVFGPLEVLAGGESVPLGSARQRALLALLLVHASEWVSVDRVIDELWAERPPATAHHAVHVYASGLRKLLRAAGHETELQGSESGYRLEADSERVDVRRFERLIEDGQRLLDADPARARDLFGEAVALWRGPPLAEQFEFAAREADTLQELAQAGLVEPRIACGEHAHVIGMLTSLVPANSLRKQPRRLLMLALYRTGRHAEALAVYRDACDALDEIGLQPSPELRTLEEATLRHDSSLAVPCVGDDTSTADPAPQPGLQARWPIDPAPQPGLQARATPK